MIRTLLERMTEPLDWALDLLAGLDPVTLVLLLGLFTALETTALIGTLVPGDLAVLLAGSTVDSPARFALVLATAAIGTYTGELIGYGIGRAEGPRLRTSRLGRLIGEQRWARTEAYLAGRGAPTLIPIRFVSVLHAVAPVVAGTVRMPLRRFAGWAGLGALTWAASYTAVGAAAGTAYREYGYLGLLSTIAVAGTAGTIIVLRRWRRRGPARPAGGDHAAAGGGGHAGGSDHAAAGGGGHAGGSDGAGRPAARR
jgi:membrane-associated protein